MRILMVEDEIFMAEAVKEVLKKNNYSVDLVFDGEIGLECGLSGVYDIIILDIMVPKINGIDILKELRNNNIETPIILLTARGDIDDKIIGLDSGADDYLTKPFEIEELLARLRALGRRQNNVLKDNILKHEDINLNPLTLKLSCNNKEFTLTLKESQLLELLIKRKNNILSKSSIIDKIWGYESDVEDNHVEVYISFLRKKLKSIKSKVIIKTIRGVGYLLSVEEK